MLTIATEKEKDRTLYNIVSKYVKSKSKNNKIYIIHRLDKDTSGIIMFAKNIKVKEELQKNWNDLVIRKSYLEKPIFKVIMDLISSNEFKNEIEGLGGYDLKDIGKIISET